jgi:hypothetical protein
LEKEDLSSVPVIRVGNIGLKKWGSRHLKIMTLLETPRFSAPTFWKEVPYFSKPREITLLQIPHEGRYTLYLSNDIKNEDFYCCMRSLALHKALKQRSIKMLPKTAILPIKLLLLGIIR